MIYKNRKSEGFVCKVCGESVEALNFGGKHRNHCPNCLHSVHLDNLPGDRQSDCSGVMEPIGVLSKDGDWSIVHRCKRCGEIHVNRIAHDDNLLKLVSLAVKPISNPPFPLEYLKKMTEK